MRAGAIPIEVKPLKTLSEIVKIKGDLRDLLQILKPNDIDQALQFSSEKRDTTRSTGTLATIHATKAIIIA